MENFSENLTETITPNFTFNWKIEKSLITDSLFLKKKMVEYTNIKQIYGFLSTNMGISYIGNYRYKNNIAFGVNTEQEQIENYKKSYNKKLGAFQLGFILPKHKWGRIIPANYSSLSVFHRPTRHTLSKDYYVDIDMVNCQPTILNEICKINGMEKKILNKYVKNPKKYREFIMKYHNCSKDIAKQLFICLMFGGSYTSWLKDNDIQENKDVKVKEVNDLEIELKSVMEVVYIANQTIKEDVLRQTPNHWVNDNEAKRGVMALWSQTIERLFQERAIKFLTDNKGFQIEKIVPCQDGFMILKELWYDDILKDIETSVYETFNVKIQFINKPFDEGIHIPEFEEDKDYDEWDDLLSVKRLADKFIELYGNYIVKYKSCVYVYWVDNTTGGRWYDETLVRNQHKLTLYISEKLYDDIKKFLINAVELESKQRSKLLKILRTNTSKSTTISDIIKHILSKAKENENDFNQNPFLIGFNNGVFDLSVKTNSFRPYKFDDYMTITTGYDYKYIDPEAEDNKLLLKELDEIFRTIQPNEEHRKLLLQILASGLDGRLYQKLFLLNGQGGNGKGLIASLMKAILGGYFHQPTNGVLKDAEKSNAPSPDLYNLKGKRYIDFTEVGGLIRVAMLRNLTGGTTFTARLLNQNPESFTLNATFVMEFNNPPELDGKPQQADYRRLVDIYFPINFTDDPNKMNREIAGVKYVKANSYYETDDFINKIKPIFLYKLIQIYQSKMQDNIGMTFDIPEDVRKRTEQFIENQNLFQKVFNEIYVKVDISPNVKDNNTIKLKEIWETIVASQEYRNITYREKRQYGREEFYKWVETIGFKICEESKVKVIKGIQCRDKIDNSQNDFLDDDDEPMYNISTKTKKINLLDAGLN